MISIQNISKSYKEVQAVRDISLEVKKGELFGLIGPDGAGKTTLMRILMTLFVQENGTAKHNVFDLLIDLKTKNQSEEKSEKNKIIKKNYKKINNY